MTTQQLNRDVKRLSASIVAMHQTVQKNNEQDVWFEFLENYAKKEFIRLYNADNTLNSLTKDSILLMLSMNIKFRFVSLHTFGLMINKINF